MARERRGDHAPSGRRLRRPRRVHRAEPADRRPRAGRGGRPLRDHRLRHRRRPRRPGREDDRRRGDVLGRRRADGGRDRARRSPRPTATTTSCPTCASAWRAGPVLQREADLFGPVVNRASRIVGIAFPGTRRRVRRACTTRSPTTPGFTWRRSGAASSRTSAGAAVVLVRRATAECPRVVPPGGRGARRADAARRTRAIEPTTGERRRLATSEAADGRRARTTPDAEDAPAPSAGRGAATAVRAVAAVDADRGPAPAPAAAAGRPSPSVHRQIVAVLPPGHPPVTTPRREARAAADPGTGRARHAGGRAPPSASDPCDVGR